MDHFTRANFQVGKGGLPPPKIRIPSRWCHEVRCNVIPINGPFTWANFQVGKGGLPPPKIRIHSGGCHQVRCDVIPMNGPFHSGKFSGWEGWFTPAQDPHSFRRVSSSHVQCHSPTRDATLSGLRRAISHTANPGLPEHNPGLELANAFSV
jgi:hypothetical protein